MLNNSPTTNYPVTLDQAMKFATQAHTMPISLADTLQAYADNILLKKGYSNSTVRLSEIKVAFKRDMKLPRIRDALSANGDDVQDFFFYV